MWKLDIILFSLAGIDYLSVGTAPQYYPIKLVLYTVFIAIITPNQLQCHIGSHLLTRKQISDASHVH